MLCINANLTCSLDYAVFLLENGADINRQDNSGRTALLMACHWGESDLLNIFLSYKPDLNLSTYLDVKYNKEAITYNFDNKIEK